MRAACKASSCVAAMWTACAARSVAASAHSLAPVCCSNPVACASPCQRCKRLPGGDSRIPRSTPPAVTSCSIRPLCRLRRAARDRELAAAGLCGMRRMIRAVEPPHPSARLTRLGAGVEAVARSRGTTPAALFSAWRTDLDWIVMTAIAKDHDHRYASVGELAADVQRHRDDEPVPALPRAGGRCGARARRAGRRPHRQSSVLLRDPARQGPARPGGAPDQLLRTQRSLRSRSRPAAAATVTA